jgi:peroxiredoxin
MKKCFLGLVLLLTLTISMAQSAAKGLNVNDKAPAFKAKDQNGKKISLSKELKNGSVVVLFYRGQWCPFCNKQIAALQDSLSLLTAKGATVIGVSPEKPENISKTIEKTKATFSIVHDKGLKIMKAYDVAFGVDAPTVEKYKGYGIDFEQANGTNGANLPVPAVYIINKEGKITYRFFDTDYRKRPSVAELLNNL